MQILDQELSKGTGKEPTDLILPEIFCKVSKQETSE